MTHSSLSSEKENATEMDGIDMHQTYLLLLRKLFSAIFRVPSSSKDVLISDSFPLQVVTYAYSLEVQLSTECVYNKILYILIYLFWFTACASAGNNDTMVSSAIDPKCII